MKIMSKHLRYIPLMIVGMGLFSTYADAASRQSPIAEYRSDIEWVRAGGSFSVQINSAGKLYAGLVADDTIIANLEISNFTPDWSDYIAVRPDVAINPASGGGFIATNKTNPNVQVRYYLYSDDTVQTDPVTHWLYLPLQGNGGMYSNKIGRAHV